jgi:hypothetical protein
MTKVQQQKCITCEVFVRQKRESDSSKSDATAQHIYEKKFVM